jgi:flavorubredoxin
MYKPIEVSKNIFYVGVNDRTKHLFEGLWTLPHGVSYNSYLAIDEKIALIDTVDICYSDVYFRKITSVLGEKPIDYLIVNHMEPDHSGSIEWLVTKYPNIQIVGNNRTAEMLKGFYNISDNVLIIKDGDEISLGTQTLQFYLTPMVHWPETMMTYIPQSKTIFSGDAFGSFGTIDGGVTDTQLRSFNWYWHEMVRYYAAIVGKFGSPVQAALKKLAGVEINTICSTHGPVWTEPENIKNVVNTYDKLSRYDADSGLVIAYGSMYGNTEQLAEIIAAEAASLGVKNIILHNVSTSDLSYILRDIFKYKGLIIGSPTYNSKLYPGVENLVNALQSRNLKNRFFGYFGSFSWAGTAVKQLKEFTETVNFDVVGEPIEMKQSLNNDVAEKARELARKMAEKLL